MSFKKMLERVSVAVSGNENLDNIADELGISRGEVDALVKVLPQQLGKECGCADSTAELISVSRQRIDSAFACWIREIKRNPALAAQQMTDILNSDSEAVAKAFGTYFVRWLSDEKSSVYYGQLESLDLTTGTINCLRSDLVGSVFDLCNRTETELLKIPNLGKSRLNEIKGVLLKRGLLLRGT